MLPRFAAFLQEGQYLRNWSPKTTRLYQQAATSVAASGAPFTSEGLSAWIIASRAKGLRPGAINAYIRALNSYLTWAKAQGLDTPARLRQMREPTAPPRTIPRDTVSRMLKARPTTYGEWRMAALVALLLDTGIRIDEALTLRLQDVDLDALLVTVVGKGRKTRLVPMSREARQTLYRWRLQREAVPGEVFLAAKTGSAWEYQNCRRDLLKAHGVTPHLCRHTFASTFIAAGGDAFQLQRILGHGDLKTTLRYVHLQTADLQRAHQAYGGLRQYRQPPTSPR
jgi:site-specific recombinase XerD